jgi:hypothetical protein
VSTACYRDTLLSETAHLSSFSLTELFLKNEVIFAVEVVA